LPLKLFTEDVLPTYLKNFKISSNVGITRIFEHALRISWRVCRTVGRWFVNLEEYNYRYTWLIVF